MNAFVLLLLSTDPGSAVVWVGQLGHDSFEARARAEEEVQKRATRCCLTLPLVHQIARHTHDAEVRLRAGQAAANALSVRVDGLGYMPMLDGAWFDVKPPSGGTWFDPSPSLCGREYVLSRPIHSRVCHPLWPSSKTGEAYIEAAGGRDLYPYTNYRAGTRLYCANLVLSGCPDWLLHSLLDEMHENDYQWWSDQVEDRNQRLALPPDPHYPASPFWPFPTDRQRPR